MRGDTDSKKMLQERTLWRGWADMRYCLLKTAEVVVVDVAGKTEQSRFFRLEEGAVCCVVAGGSEGAQQCTGFCTFPLDM